MGAHSMPALGFIGLGQMGSAMASNLLAAGFPLSVFNRTQTVSDTFAKQAALHQPAFNQLKVASTAADAVSSGGIVLTMLANDAALESVCVGEQGFLERLGQGGIHLSMSTVAPETSRKLAIEHAKHGSLFVAAPVFGRPDAAAARKLWICQSGDVAAKMRLKPVLEALGQGVYDFGEDPGAANVIKLAGNFLIFSAVEALAEALALAEKNGLERKALTDFFGQTNFACPIYQNYGRILAERAFEPVGFKLELAAKDLRLAQAAATAADVPMPLAELLAGRFQEALLKGRGEMDCTAIEISTAEAAGLNSGS